nr:ABC transporter ATP-binding protein [Alcanivorax sp. 24]
MNDYVLSTRKLTKRFHGFCAISDVDINVREGAVHALIGPNGAGKSTCFNLITRFLTPSSGRIYYRGEDITSLRAAEVAGRGMVRSFQISSIFPELSCIENVEIAIQKREGLSFNFWRHQRALQAHRDETMDLLACTRLAAEAGQRAGSLPYGKRRALEIATTLAMNPSVLLLDEPMAGLGREDIAAISDLIKEIRQGRTIVMVEHNLDVVRSLSDTVTVLEAGQVICQGVYEEVSTNPRVMEAYLGAGDDDE